MQLTALSPVVMLTALEVIFDVGMFCEGPVDPWSFNDSVAAASLHVIYWILCTVYNHVSPRPLIKRYMHKSPPVPTGLLACRNIASIFSCIN